MSTIGLAVAATVALAIDLHGQSQPARLALALKALPNVRVLDESDVRESLKDLKELGYWPPWVVGDIDGDGREDIVAAVVLQTATGKQQYGVLAIHSKTPSEIHWVVPFSSSALMGVTANSVKNERRIVIPLSCIFCDANGWLRWSGTTYKWFFHDIGNRFQAKGGKDETTLRLFQSPSMQAASIQRSICEEVTVRRVVGTPENRWYFVQTLRRPQVTATSPRFE